MNHPFASLTISYFIGALVCFFLLIIEHRGHNISYSFLELNWTSILIGIVLVGVETGLYYLYKNGNYLSSTALIISVAQTITNTITAYIIFRERPSAVIVLGLIIGVTGSYLAISNTEDEIKKKADSQ